MPTCPNGHQSGSDDWCEVCGHRMGGPAVPPPPAQPGPGYGYHPQGQEPARQPELCPQCRTPREANAPYCEECRWNFLTNTATSYTPLAPPQRTPQGPGPRGAVNLPPGFQNQPPAPPQVPGPAEPYEPTGTRPSQINRPAEPLMSEQAPGPSGAVDDGWGAPPPPPPFERVSPPPPPFERVSPPPSPTADGWAQGTPAAPPFEQASAPAHQGPGPAADWGSPRPEVGGDWTLPPPSEAEHQQQPRFPGTARWSVVIGPDPIYFQAMMQRSGPEAAGLNLPAYSPEQQMPLTGNQVSIGRHRHSTGEAPDIDLSLPPEDPGVSHQHAILVQQPDGGWAVVDQNSTNGTTVNGGEEPIQPFVPVPLDDGDRVHVGAWTTLRVVRD
ncbi:FHA domain-containing protein [Streptomyces sp. NRRL F-5126]|uniref:FHA domain-containing protein n=1 Tax=Streptomyces sp. NRRL F-5126 TaxID=1463857 RepID=UPI0004C7A7F7|nr:FHA domain-containing protein [Streptomyces sp. NRRL F-5126]